MGGFESYLSLKDSILTIRSCADKVAEILSDDVPDLDVRDKEIFKKFVKQMICSLYVNEDDDIVITSDTPWIQMFFNTYIWRKPKNKKYEFPRLEKVVIFRDLRIKIRLSYKKSNVNYWVDE